MYTGRTDTNKVVIFKPKDGLKIGDMVQVEILEAHKWFLLGEVEK